MVCVPHNTLYFPLCQSFGHLRGDFFDATKRKKRKKKKKKKEKKGKEENCQSDFGWSLIGRVARRDSK